MYAKNNKEMTNTLRITRKKKRTWRNIDEQKGDKEERQREKTKKQI